MMEVKQAGPYVAEFLLSEGNGQISREKITLASGPAYEPGQVLGVVTASGKYTAYNPEGSDGSEVAVGILYAGVPASDVDRSGTGIVRLAEVTESLLIGGDASALADLQIRNIICR